MGKRLVTVSETAQDDVINEEMVKNMTGGDDIVCRNLYQSMIEYVAIFKMFLITNHLPKMSNTSSMLRRPIVVDFPAEFVDRPSILNLETGEVTPKPFEHPEHQRDMNRTIERDLKTKECKEAILNWLIDGAYRYLKDGKINYPERLQVVTQGYKDNLNNIPQFMQERLTPEPGKTMTFTEIYGHYQTWLKNRLPASETKLGRELTKVYGKTKDKGVVVYLDVGLKSSTLTVE